MYLAMFATFIISLVMINVLIAPAHRMQLLDRPDGLRKRHSGSIPLIGGISIFSSFLLSLFALQILTKQDYTILLFCSFVIVLLGVIDDMHDVSFRLRIVAQCVIATIMFTFGDNGILHLGNLLNHGVQYTGGWGLPLTVLAVLCGINALNMLDGIDGLAICTALVSLAAILFIGIEQSEIAVPIALLFSATLPLLLANMGLLGQKRKVFLGDAGSLGLGFVITWFLIKQSLPTDHSGVKPIVAVWLFALPLMDMSAVSILRLSKGLSPFHADRRHLHHVLQRLNFSDRGILFVMTAVHACFAVFGVGAHLWQIPEQVLLYLYLGIFVVYLLFVINQERLPPPASTPQRRRHKNKK